MTSPLYPLYDKNRNVIWVGDTAIDRDRILEFNLTSGKFIEHKLNGTSIVTVMAFDHNNNNQIWYVDPLLKRLGHYYPSANTTKLYTIPTARHYISYYRRFNNNVWLTSPDSNELLRFNSQAKNFTMLHLPTINAMPIGILLDKATGMIWIAGGIGKLFSIDRINSDNASCRYDRKSNTLMLSTTIIYFVVASQSYSEISKLTSQSTIDKDALSEIMGITNELIFFTIVGIAYIIVGFWMIKRKYHSKIPYIVVIAGS